MSGEGQENNLTNLNEGSNLDQDDKSDVGVSEPNEIIYREKYLDQVCKCGRVRGKDKNFKNWAHGRCGSCNQKLYYQRKRKEKQTDKPVKSKCGRKKKGKFNEKTENISFFDLLSFITTVLEGLTKNMKTMHDNQTDAWGLEQSQRFKLHQRLVKLEEFNKLMFDPGFNPKK